MHSKGELAMVRGVSYVPVAGSSLAQPVVRWQQGALKLEPLVLRC